MSGLGSGLGSGLAGLRVAFAAFEAFPNAKGSGTRIGQMVRALLEGGAEVTLLTLPGRVGGADLPPALVHRPLAVSEQNYLARATAFARRVRRELASARPEVVHFRGPFEGGAAVDYARAARRLSIFEVNGLPSVELRYHYPALAEAPELTAKLRALEGRVLAKAGLVITQSETTRSFLLGRGLRPEVPTFVLPNGADPIEEAKEAEAREEEPGRLLYIGSFAPWQGVSELLMALRRCHHAGLPLRLRLIGAAKKSWRWRLLRASRRLGIEGQVELLEPTPRADLIDEIRRARICLAPLRADLRNEEQGCSPIKLYEYMAAGRPILSTELRSVREILEHDRSGWLVRPGQPRALAEGIARLATDPALRERLGQRARAEQRAEHRWDQRRAALREIYARALERAALASA